MLGPLAPRQRRAPLLYTMVQQAVTPFRSALNWSRDLTPPQPKKQPPKTAVRGVPPAAASFWVNHLDS